MGFIADLNDEKIMRSFPTNQDYLCYVILEIMTLRNYPMGAGVLEGELGQLGIDAATATVGRALQALDHNGFCDKISNKGRAVTRAGIRFVEDNRYRIEKDSLGAGVANALSVSRFDDLIELLHTRLIIEREAIRLAVQNASEQDIALMKAATQAHKTLLHEQLDDSKAGLDFHSLIVDASKNKFMSAVSRLLAHEEHRIESIYPIMNPRNHAIEFIGVHEELAEAIAERNGEKAASIMENHLLHIIELVRQRKERF